MSWGCRSPKCEPEPDALIRTVRLRGLAAPSRVLFGPIETNLADERSLSARHTAFYRRRAAGGAGLIVTEIASVHESDWPYERAPLASACAPGWADVVAACQPHGTLVLAGLGHAGGQGLSAWHQTALWAPSPVPDAVSREMPYPVEQPEIDELIGGFAASASLAVSAGCHGVELNAGQHSILRQFLSGLTNHRTDDYGVDRGRLLTEVLTEVRAALGEGALLGLRLCADELAPWAGITAKETCALLVELAPLLDYVVPVRGAALSVSATRPDLHTPPGFNRDLCAGVRAALRDVGSELAVVLQGSVVDVSMAAASIRTNRDGPTVAATADLVEMTRAQLAAPDLVALTRAGHPERIRPCTLTNQHSWVRDPRNPIISDEGEPSTGHETDDVAVAPDLGLRLPLLANLSAAGAARVLVVGGGPAGLEAARVAALLGHLVHLVESSTWLGGALRPAAAVRGRGRLGLLADWLVAEVYRLGVIVRTGAALGRDELDAAVQDGSTVLLCTGSRPARPSFTVGPGVVVVAAAEFEADVLASASTSAALAALAGANGEPRVLVHDPVGDWTGVGIAEQVAAAGVRCTLVTPDPVAGVQLSRTGDLTGANARLQCAGVRRELFATLLGARHGRAELADVHTNERRSVRCTLVIDCARRLPEDGLWLLRPELSRAGDCVAPRTVHEAVLEGRRIAQGVEGSRR
jgi:mycofactocin system FadH/OYE family oxidoreductase 1